VVFVFFFFLVLFGWGGGWFLWVGLWLVFGGVGCFLVFFCGFAWVFLFLVFLGPLILLSRVGVPVSLP